MRRRDFLKHGGIVAVAVCASSGVGLPIFSAAPGWAQPLRRANYMSAAGLSLASSYTFTAVETGFFKEEGLDINLQIGPGTAAAIAQVASANAMFGQAAPITSCPAIADQNATLLTVGQVSYPGFFEIASLPGKPLTHPRELQGKTIGIMSKGGSTELLLDAMARSHGVDPSSINRVITGISSAGVAFLERGQVDAFFVFYETKVALEHQGAKLAYMVVDDFVTLPGDALIVSSSVVNDADREDVLVRYLRAAIRAMRFIHDPANTEKVLDFHAKYNPVQAGERERNRRTLEIVRRFLTPPEGTPAMRMHEESWTKGLALLEEIGVIKNKGLPHERYYTNRYIDRALKA